MPNWLDFEKECERYLNATYANGCVSFEGKGGHDATQLDISVLKNGLNDFYVEAKMPNSQCGQFVLLQDLENKKFIFSPRNDSDEQDAMKIIEHMNENFDLYRDGHALKIDPDAEYRWVMKHYHDNGARFFITKNQSSFMIFPVTKLANYFSIDATYRIKGSGSASVPARSRRSVIDLLRLEDPDAKTWVEDKHLCVRSDKLAARTTLIDGDNRYYVSPTENAGVFRIRKLSHTRNMNVIFSISLKPEVRQNPDDLAEFLQALNA